MELIILVEEKKATYENKIQFVSVFIKFQKEMAFQKVAITILI